jgi:hypothetical protein
MKHESVKQINYEKIENVRPENYQSLLADLRQRTGLNIHRADIKNVDFQNDTARLVIYYYTNTDKRSA